MARGWGPPPRLFGSSGPPRRPRRRERAGRGLHVDPARAGGARPPRGPRARGRAGRGPHVDPARGREGRGLLRGPVAFPEGPSLAVRASVRTFSILSSGRTTPLGAARRGKIPWAALPVLKWVRRSAEGRTRGRGEGGRGRGGIAEKDPPRPPRRRPQPCSRSVPGRPRSAGCTCRGTFVNSQFLAYVWVYIRTL